MELAIGSKIALVTGGSKGIGLACAKMLSSEGARVALCSRSQANVDAALAGLPGARGFAADLTADDQALRMIDAVEEQLGPIDILVYVTGVIIGMDGAQIPTVV